MGREHVTHRAGAEHCSDPIAPELRADLEVRPVGWVIRGRRRDELAARRARIEVELRRGTIPQRAADELEDRVVVQAPVHDPMIRWS